MILVAAGEERMYGRICDSLVESGYEILSVPEGAVIPELVRDKKPELVLIAGAMPDIGVVALCEAIAEAAGVAKVPIVILSSKLSAAEKLSAFRAGARRIVTEADPEAVVKEVGRTLEQLEISKKIMKYHESCGDETKDFGVFPGNLDVETEQCELNDISSKGEKKQD
jgi:DNA-binding response OmpR family regulator